MKACVAAVLLVVVGCAEPRAIGEDNTSTTRDDASAGGANGANRGGSGGLPGAATSDDAGAGGTGGVPVDANPIDVPAGPVAPVCTGTQRICGGQCIEGCCNDADCPASGAKVGRCDPVKRACSAECAEKTKPCNGGCMPEAACCPSPEICDGKDNDCDGAVDQNLSIPCMTACGMGMQICSNGSFGVCSAPVPSAEICDNKDNDCDGAIDETLTMDCSSACGTGRKTCSAGAWGACTAPSPSAESCDNKDNDCNGRVDDGLTRDCPSSCGPGKEICSAGKWGACSAKQPSQTDVNACGSGCLHCNAAPAHGTANCVAGQCGFACKEAGFRAECNGQCVACCGANASTCAAGEICSGNQCQCEGVKCGARCAGKIVGCVALIRSQTADPCGNPLSFDPVACRATGPIDDLNICQIGVIRRQLVPESSSCDFDALGRGGCKTYLCQNRQPGLDINMPIVVSYVREQYDANGRAIATPNPGNTTCQALGVVSCN